MIVERITWRVKHYGCRAELIQLTKAMVEETGLTPRVSSYRFGPSDIVTSDLEFESEEERKKWWAGIDWSQPAAVERTRKSRELLAPGTTRELLVVH